MAHLTIEFNTDNQEWQKHLPNSQQLCERMIRETIAHNTINDYAEKITISVLLTTDAVIQALNHRHRHKNTPTNVLAFPQYLLNPYCYDGPKTHILLGDIALSLETIKKEAKGQQKNLHNHFCHLLVHATLHLLGFDHEGEEQARHMEGKEIAILGKCHITNPYI